LSYPVEQEKQMNNSPMNELKFSKNGDALLSVPWWQVGVMWFFAGGLGAVVLASFALLFTAVQHRDTVLPHDAQSTASVRTTAVPNTPSSPAMQARNHAASPAR
jgi:uncharacterized protein